MSRGPKSQKTGACTRVVLALLPAGEEHAEGIELGMQLRGAEPRVGIGVFESWKEAQKSNPIPHLEIRNHKPREVKP